MRELNEITDIKNVLYINLSFRQDRKEHIEKQLKTVGFNSFERFNAINIKNGALGCSMSHLKCIEYAKKNNWDHVLICEDDTEFLSPEILKKQVNIFLEKNKNWDVLLLAGNNMLPYLPYHECAIQIYNCLTTTCYIVREHYYDKLIQNYNEGIMKLMQNSTEKNTYCIDKYWLNLQRQDKWFLIIPLTVIQREDYSDIEKKVTNFKKYMLDYNKCIKK
jgi:GR25 family glycosyltransferase involved in LPS biosynthesis